MNPEGQTLIALQSVSKVFTTDEVETHALAGIELKIRKGEYVSISGPSGCGKSTCSPSWACSTRPPRVRTF